MDRHQISVPAQLLRRCHWVRVLLLRYVSENGQLLGQLHRVFSLLFFLGFLEDVEPVLICRLLSDDVQIFRVEVEVLLEDAATVLALQGLGPLSIELDLVEVLVRCFRLGCFSHIFI